MDAEVRRTFILQMQTVVNGALASENLASQIDIGLMRFHPPGRLLAPKHLTFNANCSLACHIESHDCEPSEVPVKLSLRNISKLPQREESTQRNVRRMPFSL